MYSLIICLLTGHLPHLLVRPERRPGRLRRLLPAAAGHHDVRGLPLDGRHLVRRPRRPADPADPPLGRADVHRRDHRCTCARLLHRRVPQAARDQLGDRLASCRCWPWSRASPATRCRTTCSPAPACAPPRASCGRSRSSGRTCRSFVFGGPFPGEAIIPPPVLRARPAAAGDHRRAVHRPHRAGLRAQAHPVPRAGPDQHERRRLPVHAGLRRQGRWLLLHRLRRHRADRRRWSRSTRSGPTGPTTRHPVTAGSQPDWYMGFADGALRLLPGWLEFVVFGCTCRFNVFLGAILLIPVMYDADRRLPVPREVGHRRQPRAPPARPAAQRPDPHRARVMAVCRST